MGCLCGLRALSLDRLAERADTFGASFDRRLASAGVAMHDRFLAALAQTALKRIPAATDAYRAIADYN